MSDDQATKLVVSDDISSLSRVARRKLAKKNDRVRVIGATTREVQNEICEVTVHGEYALVRGLEAVSRLRKAYSNVLNTPEAKEAAKQRDELFAEVMMRIELGACKQILEELMQLRKHLDNDSFIDKLLELRDW